MPAAAPTKRNPARFVGVGIGLWLPFGFGQYRFPQSSQLPELIRLSPGYGGGCPVPMIFQKLNLKAVPGQAVSDQPVRLQFPEQRIGNGR